MSQLYLIGSIPMPELGEGVFCQIYESSRARKTWIRICSENGLCVVVPRRLPNKEKTAQELLKKNEKWVKRHWQRAEVNQRDHLKAPDELIVGDKVFRGDDIFQYINEFLINRTLSIARGKNFGLNKVIVRRKKHHWGSCTKRKTISLNWKIYLLPEPLRDYVIYHELAHLREFNHSRNFWALLEELYPGSREHNKVLKQYICS